MPVGRLAFLSRPSVWLSILLAGLVLTGCQPRQRVPRDVGLLLPAAQDAVHYRRLTLPNGLKVMLVSDPNADRSAAALSVGVGSLSDPRQRPGLAHFLEHMLFLGTKKYPEPGAYAKFMSSHNGFSNAYTADDQTNFYFEVAPGAFDEALDRFSQFFVAPLFNQTYAEREMNAVDSEHAKNVENDYWRIRQIQRDQYLPNHPLHHFSTGDLKTLRGVGHEELTAFYRDHYSSNLMALAVVANEPLDALQKQVESRFDQIRDRHLSAPRYPEVYLAQEPALRVLRIQPVKDQRLLMMKFPLPPVEKYYRSKPLQMISFVLGHEGKGSLLSLLKQEQLASSLSAGPGDQTADYASLNLTIGLTPQGLTRWREVVEQVMGAIRGLREKGIPPYIYQENQVMSELDWRYRGPQDAADRARSLSALMQSYPMDELPRAAYLVKAYTPKLYESLLAHLTPENMLVTLVANGVPTNKVEPYYGARYSLEQITGAYYQSLLTAKPAPVWHLPLPNPFIPRKVTLLAPDGPLKLAETTFYHLKEDGVPHEVRAKLLPLENESYTGAQALMNRVSGVLSVNEQRHWLPTLLKDSLALPVRLLDMPQAKVWYLPAWRLREPKAQIVLKFFVDGAYGSARQAALAQAYEAVIAEGLNEYGYPIREAGLDFGIDTDKGGIVLTLEGYSSRMLDLLQFLVSRLRQVDIDKATFASLKERMVRVLENQKLAQPYSQSEYFSRMFLVKPSYSREALLKALRPLTLAEVKAYAGNLLKSTYVEGVVAGNLSRDDARQAIRKALSTLGATVLPAARRVRETVTQLPPGADWVYSRRLSVNNSLISLYYQVGKTNPTLRGALLLIGRPLGESFYFNLRTQQQLGYIVWAGMAQIRKTLGLAMLIQSGQYPADRLLNRADAFVPRFIEQFKAMPAKQFEKYRAAVIQAKLERPKNLAEVAGRLAWTAFHNDEKWDYVSRDIDAVRALKRTDVETVLTYYLAGRGERRLVIRLIGRGQPAGKVKGQPVPLPEASPPETARPAASG